MCSPVYISILLIFFIVSCYSGFVIGTLAPVSEKMDAVIDNSRCVMPYPEVVDGKIDTMGSVACVTKYNRFGSIFAIGCLDGRIFLMNHNDIRKAIVKHFTQHVSVIHSLCFSRDSRYLVSTSQDMNIIIWDIVEGVPVKCIRSSGVCLSAFFNPRNSQQLVVYNLNQSIQVYNTETLHCRNLVYSIPGTGDDSFTCFAFERHGKYIICGSAKGRIVVYDSATLNIVTFFKQGGNHQIKQIWISRKGDFALTNNSDKVLRCYSIESMLNANRGQTLEPNNKFSDTVDRRAWAKCAANGTMDYVCGLVQKDHGIFIWERSTGTVVKRLFNNSGNGATDIQWHPTKPIISTVYKGEVYIWKDPCAENWSGFAPDFTEIEDNIKYREREGEFDLEDEDASQDQINKEQAEEDIIDVETLDDNAVYCSSDEDNVPLNDLSLRTGNVWYLPAKIDVDPNDDADEKSEPLLSEQMIIKLQERCKREAPHNEVI
uniref:Retinoblastoma-binding protein homolog 5 (projected from Caenorhabditis elegans ortholog rbbp-5) n=1 Tax=Strongyloides venezuelensis TaxID=75913 RepID=A0A0K0FMP4_STRVS